jgi:tRNA nucleotidyltransferase (CCA-adding enzyme)
MGWEHFAHGADIGIRGTGDSLGEAFEQAALALTAVVTDPAGVVQESAVEIHCEAPDDELLLADWLNALIYEMATRGLIFGRHAVRIDGGKLDASAWGEALDRARHRPAVEPKAATYTELAVRRHEDGTWTAQCVIDV